MQAAQSRLNATESTPDVARRYQNRISQMRNLQNAFNVVNSMSGKYNVSSITATSATEKFSAALAKERVTLGSLLKSRALFNASLKEQIALQNASVVSFGRTATGKTSASVLVPNNFIPRDFRARMDSAVTRVGMFSQAMKSAGNTGGEWARGMQRTGFQITQGIGVPLAAISAVAAKVFYDVDKQLTAIAKVYDTTAQDVMGKQRELDALRANSISNAQALAKQYGASVTDTLKAESELAATGQKGNDLLKATGEVQRAAILGQLDQEQALKATISMQSIYQDAARATGNETQWLADQFNFMNQVENQTSLTMQDMVEAFPKILPVIKTMGGTIQDAAVFLAGFKQNGISATEGANAFRTGINRLINPAGTVVKRLSELGVEVGDIGTKTGGKPLLMLQELSKRMEGLSALEKQQVVGKLFGSYQVARMTALLDSLKSIGDETTQIGRAFAATGQSTEEWAAVAETEMNRLQQSASMKFKKILEVIKGQLITFGEPVLEMATDILQAFSGFLDFFNKMPDAAKKMLIIATIGTVIGGAVLLVIGAFGNLLYTALRVAGSIGTAVTQFKMLNMEQLVARAAAQDAATAQAAQNSVMATAAGRMNAFTAAARGAAAAQLGLAQATARAGQIAAPTTFGRAIGPMNLPVQGPVNARAQYSNAIGPNPQNGAAMNGGFMANGRQYTKTADGAAGRINYREDGARTAPSTYAMAQAQSKAADAAKEQAKATASAAANSAKIASAQRVARADSMLMGGALMSVAFALPAIQQIRKEGELTATSASMLGLAFVGLLPVLGQVGAAIKGIGIAGMAGGIRAAGGAMVAFLGPLGIALIAAAALGAAFYKINRELTESSRNADKLNESTKTWSEILGYTNTASSTEIDKQSESTEKQASNIEKLKSSNEGLYNALKDVENQEEAVSRARNEGLKVIASGGGRDQAISAMRAVMGLNGINGQEQDAQVKLNMDVAIANPEEAKKMLIDETSKLIDEALKEVQNRSLVSKIFDPGMISDDAEAAAKLAAGNFTAAFRTETDRGSQSDMLKEFINNWNTQSTSAFEQIRNDNQNAKLFDKLGIKNMTDLTRVMDQATSESIAMSKAETQSGQATVKATAASKARANLLKNLSSNGKDLTQTEGEMAREIARSTGMSDKQVKSVHSLNDLWKALGLSFKDTAGTGAATEGLNEVEGAADDAGQALQDAAADAEDTRKKMVDALKDSMSGTMDAVFDAFSRKREQDQEAQLERIAQAGQNRIDRLDAQEEAKEAEFSARQEAGEKDFEARQKALRSQQQNENKKFEADWDVVMENHNKKFEDEKTAVEAAADARIQGVEDAIAAEQEAEETRQRIFEAEQARMQRLSEMFNRNIDFNAALNSGNLDEAAKIQNDSSSASMQWAADDTAAVAGSGSDARTAALDKQKEALETQKDDALKAIDVLEEAEQKQLEDQKDRAKELLEVRQDAQNEQLQNEQEAWSKSLKQEQDRYSKSIEEQRKAIQKQTDAATKGAQARNDIENRRLEMELAAQKAMTPRTIEELNNQIAQVSATYDKYGTTYVKPTAKSWGEAFGNEQQWAMQRSANATRNDINWAEIGTKITDDMASGFDLTGDQLLSWLKTGVFPGSTAGGSVSGAAAAKGSSAGRVSNGFSGGITRHSGGAVNWSSADRVGVPRSAGLYPSEVPAILKRGEFVMNERATRAHGATLSAMNSGVVRHSGGPVTSGIGSGGLIGAAVGKAVAQGIANQLAQTVGNMVQSTAGYGVAGAGKYGNIKLNDEQLNNASIIMNVGKAMGASNRDLIVAIATAMQESTLRNLNHGDRDSVGLFQQRTSMGWGTVEQIMNPEYSARKFFEALLKKKDRDSMSVTQAAQSVQRSGFPNAYAQWEAMATAVVNGTPTFVNPGGNAMAGGANSVGAGMTGVDKNGFTYPSMISIMDTSGVPFQVTSTKRNKDDGSLHNKGYAVDFDDFSSPKVDTPGLFAIWQWLYKNFGSKSSELIYSGPGATSIKNGRAHQYSASTMAGHHNHVHWGMTPQALASLGVPQLAVGGNIKYDNTLANLHKNETVLTAPLSAALERGVMNLDAGGSTGNKYEVNVINPVVRQDQDIDAIVGRTITALKDRERRNGTTRVMGR